MNRPSNIIPKAETSKAAGEAKAKTKRAAKPKAKAEKPIASIKGFNHDLTCQGFRFEPGKTFEHKGAVQVCRSGFHACTTDAHPLSVFGYYAPGTSRYFEVTQDGPFSTNDDVKICSAKITIGVELSISELTRRAIEWVFARTKPAESSSNSGDYGAASNSGYRGAASNSGDYGAASNSGDYGAASNSGTRGAASNSGDYGAASNSGDYGAASNSGYRGAASNSGYRGAASNSGDYGAASNSGTRGAASNSGDYGAASNSGYRGAASNSGDYGAASNSGDYGAAFSHAPASKVMCEGDGQALYITEFADDGSIKSAACGITGRDGIKAGTWYICTDGNLVECGK
jgi:hypothetical protein